ncbi:hypothetical protein E4T48_06394 [Aureobasidium sp. EXF-10727]|nr:hypothetical protein E4T48_06394 [Aureobasidium sp. EXF-10727]KAI4725253.1 hypothetical protein E4T49_06975 [Aureobasidium sp. EXF-10728]
MISSPLRATMNASDEKSHGLGISSPVLDVEKSPLLAQTPSLESIPSRNDSVGSSKKLSKAYLPSDRTYQHSRVPTAYVPSPHGTHLYSPKHLPKNIVSAMSEEVVKPPPAAASLNTPQRGLSLLKRTPSARRQAPPIAPPRPQRNPSISRHIPIVPQRVPSLTRQVPAVVETTPYEPQQAPTLPQIAPTAPQRGPVADAPRIQTTALYTSRRVSSMFMTPTSEMAPPMMAKTHSPERKLDTFPASPPVHLPLTKPRNLYQTRRAPTPYNPITQTTGPAAPRRFPVPYTPSNLSNPTPVSAVSGHSRCASSMALPPSVLAPPPPSSLLAPPPSIRTLNSQLRRGVSYVSTTSSVYSRLPSDDK